MEFYLVLISKKEIFDSLFFFKNRKKLVEELEEKTKIINDFLANEKVSLQSVQQKKKFK